MAGLKTESLALPSTIKKRKKLRTVLNLIFLCFPLFERERETLAGCYQATNPASIWSLSYSLSNKKGKLQRKMADSLIILFSYKRSAVLFLFNLIADRKRKIIMLSAFSPLTRKKRKNWAINRRLRTKSDRSLSSFFKRAVRRESFMKSLFFSLY